MIRFAPLGYPTLLFLAFWSYSNLARAECAAPLARLVSVQGQVEVKRRGSPSWAAAPVDAVFCAEDSVTVGARGRAALLLSDQSLLRLDQNTTVTFPKAPAKEASWLDLLKGAVYFISRVPRASQVNTPFVNAGIRGTEFLVSVGPNAATITVYEGEVIAANARGELALTSGQSAVAVAGAAPVARTVVEPRDAVQWALYYPPVIDSGDTRWQTAPWAAVRERYRRDDIAGALTALDQVPAARRDGSYSTLRAQLLLRVGRVDEARPLLEQVPRQDPANATALALQAIIAVARNDKSLALDLARRAVERDPASSTARLALSYARQAHFEIADAGASVREAVRLNSRDALAWARLAELQLALGELDAALASARQATTIDPAVARTQSVLGFAYLTRIEVVDAQAAFAEAIRLDQADPLPRLGLGLALIRRDELVAGRQQIEIAAGLDPARSLLRSYLGKAYFEEKNDKLAAAQFGLAKDLDPRDPTPWFYDALRKQTENRPVEALEDLEQSIERNDNRAVYRSRLLLDDDLATRGASLGGIYRELDYDRLALVEGWKSTTADPSNDAAHRLLSDVSSALPRNEIARVSELLQAQLRQPLSITPVQPLAPVLPKQLPSGGQNPAFTNVLIFGNPNPATGFNEYTSLFNRDRLALQASGMVGGNDTLSNELLLSGIQGPVSFSLGQYHYATDAFLRDLDNTDLRQNAYSAFVQFTPNPSTSVQAEYRYLDTEQGDLALRFNPDDFSPNLRQQQRAHLGRLGLRQALSPDSDVLGSFIFRRSDFDLSNNIVLLDEPFDVSFNREEDAYLGEILHDYRSERFSITSGIGYARARAENFLGQDTVIFGEPVSTRSAIRPDTRQANLYAYAHLKLPADAYLTLGMNVDSWRRTEKAGGDIVEFARALGGRERIDFDRQGFNPKLGLLWNLNRATTLRAAAFRATTRTLPSNQTLEPTHVAGFSQFFDDPAGSRGWYYGIGVDHKFSTRLFGGVELSRRTLSVPYATLIRDRFDTTDATERQARSYIYWTPHPWVALRVEYDYERLENGEGAGGVSLNGVAEVETHRVPLGLAVFHPSGLAFRFNPTYVNQGVGFLNTDNELEEDEDSFWVVDASLDYRLPKRWGLVSLSVKNLFDTDFRYFDTDPANPLYQPERQVFARINLAF